MSGRSIRPIGRRARFASAAGRPRSTSPTSPVTGIRSGSGGRHGRWGAGRPRAAECARTARHRRVRSVAPSAATGVRGGARPRAARRTGAPPVRARSTGPRGCHAGDLQRRRGAAAGPQIGATGQVHGAGGPRRWCRARRGSRPRRWCAGRSGACSSRGSRGRPRRSGRWVARTRCTPRDRPRWAIAIRPGTNDGSSSARVANSSTTITRRASSTVVGQGRDVHGIVRGQDLLATGQFRGERPQGAGRGLAVEVGDQADGVRQRGRLGEGRAALVVDEEEGASIGRVLQSQTRDQCLEELGLPRSGGARDEGVRTVTAEVDLERTLGRPPQGGHEPVPGGRPRAADPAGPVHRQTRRGQVEQPDAAGERAVRGDRDERGQITRELRRRAPREPVDADVRAVGHALPAEHGHIAGLAREAEDGVDGDGHVLDGVGRRDGHEADVAGRPQRRREPWVQRPVDEHDQPARSPPHVLGTGGRAGRAAAPPAWSAARSGSRRPSRRARRRRGRALPPAAGAAAIGPTPSRGAEPPR